MLVIMHFFLHLYFLLVELNGILVSAQCIHPYDARLTSMVPYNIG
uniref:Uncharacterized protein n=1 Tax=Arundo donax TaxID=35708 RepID=A0A0A8Z131_ARUDO